MDSEPVSPGMAYLVGAGPGDPGLITVKGAECLRRADVVLYDRLAHPQLLAYAPPAAERIFVGKGRGGHTLSQQQINALLVQYASQGKTVVRLKGGDPFVFGRGGEEALVLRAAGIPFEVVPGISSAVAALAYAGIPITHRGVADSFTVATGHRAPNPEGDTKCASADTLVYVMGVENLATIVDDLVTKGRDPGTPAALVHWATTPRQQTVTGTLGDIVERGRHLRPPAVLVVGSVVSLRARLDWYERQPLFGRRILVTRAREQASEMSRILAEAGAEPLELPLIQVLPLEDPCALDAALQRRHDWIAFTSVNGVRAVWQRLQAKGADARALAGGRLCAIGPETAAELAAHGLRADYVPAEYVVEAIVAGLPVTTGQVVLLPRADIALSSLAEGLRARGALVDDVVAYRTVSASLDRSASLHAVRAIESGELDAVTFASSSAVRAFVKAGLWSRRRRDPLVACIGPVTAQAARDLGLPVDVVPVMCTTPGLVAALVEHYREEPRRPAPFNAEGEAPNNTEDTG
jgi:uroporphyrinogen III methyltransferase / synthase